MGNLRYQDYTRKSLQEMLHDIKRRQDGNKATLRTNIRASMMKIYNGEMYKILTGTQAGGLHYPNPMDDYDYCE